MNKIKKEYSLETLILVFLLSLILGFLIGQIFFKSPTMGSGKNDMNDVYTTLKNEYIKDISCSKRDARFYKKRV